MVDHPKRDLPGLVLVAARLVEQGADVLLVPLNLLGAEIPALAPDLVALPYLRRHIEWVIRGALEAGIAYGVVDTEGGLYGDLDDYGATYVTDRALLEGMSVLCAWGPRTRDYVVERGLFGADQVVVTGVPRFDFYAPRWRSFFPARPAGDPTMLLVNTKVAVANPQHQSVEDEVAMYVDRLGFSPEKVEEFRRVGVESIRATLELVNRLAADRPGSRIVLRPHPHERAATYQDGIDPGAPNLEVRGEGTVDGWIVRSSAMIHRHCTTALEAGFAGVPAIAPLWVPTASNAPDAERVSIRCRTYEELVAVLDAVDGGEDVVTDEARSALARIVDEWMLAVDGRSHERVADALLDRLGEPRPALDHTVLEAMFHRLHEPWSSTRGLVGRAARLGGRGVARRTVTGLLHPAARRWAGSDKAFSASEVDALLARVHLARGGDPASPPCTVSRAVDIDAYAWGYAGHAVVVGPNEGGS